MVFVAMKGDVVKKRATLLMTFKDEFGRLNFLLRESCQIKQGMLTSVWLLRYFDHFLLFSVRSLETCSAHGCVITHYNQYYCRR